MRAEVPHYWNIYYTLLYQIICKKYPAGTKLPSRGELATSFHTSEDTVRKALSLLLEQKYIAIHKGSPPIVLLDLNNLRSLETLEPLSEQRHGMLLDLINAYRFVLPPHIYRGLARLDHSEKASFIHTLSTALGSKNSEFDRLSLQMINCLLDKVGNQTLNYFFKTTQIFLRVNLCAAEGLAQVGEKIIFIRRKMFRWLAHHLRQNLIAKQKIPRRSIEAVMNWYYDHLIQTLGFKGQQVLPQDMQAVFCNYVPKYLAIYNDLIEKIFAGRYQPGDFLPSDICASTEYHVAALTIRKAYALLHEIGFVKPIPRVGTQVTLQIGSRVASPHFKAERAMRFQIFLDALSFLKENIHCIALFACSDMKGLSEEIAALKKRCDGSAYVFKMYFLVSLLGCIVQYTGNVTFQTYFDFIKPLLFFGSYILYEECPEHCDFIGEFAEKALQLLLERNSAGFAAYLSRILADLLEKSTKYYTVMEQKDTENALSHTTPHTVIHETESITIEQL